MVPNSNARAHSRPSNIASNNPANKAPNANTDAASDYSGADEQAAMDSPAVDA